MGVHTQVVAEKEQLVREKADALGTVDQAMLLSDEVARQAIATSKAVEHELVRLMEERESATSESVSELPGVTFCRNWLAAALASGDKEAIAAAEQALADAKQLSANIYTTAKIEGATEAVGAEEAALAAA